MPDSVAALRIERKTPKLGLGIGIAVAIAVGLLTRIAIAIPMPIPTPTVTNSGVWPFHALECAARA